MNDQKQIAFLCHPYHRGGVTRWMADAAIRFAGRGWVVYFVTIEPSPAFISAWGRETLLQLLQKQNGTSLHIISEQGGREFELGTQQYRAYIYRRLLAQVPQGTPVILSDDSSVWESAVYLHKAYPIVGVLHADDPHYYALAENYFQQVAVFACVSERVSRLTKQRIPQFPAERVFTIPCGIELPPADMNVHSGSVLQLVWVGRITEHQKRVSDLVKVSELLNQRNVAFHLDIIGDGPDRPMLESKIKQAGLGSLITLHGWQSQATVGKKLSEADILVLTSDFEGTPIAMMEALAAGCGIVGTRVSGIEDYETHPLAADCFAVFEVGDIPAAADNIIKIAGKPVQVRRSSARQLAEKEFSMDVCLDRYIHAVEGIKAVPGSAGPVNIPLAALLYSKAIARARSVKLFLSNIRNRA